MNRQGTESRSRFVSISPATGKQVATYALTTAAERERVIQAAHAAFGEWRDTSPAERAQPLERAAQLLEAEKAALARLMALEMGKPLKQGRAEVEKCAWGCRYFAEEGARLLAPEPVPMTEGRASVVFAPLGVVLGIMPWNFPLWQVFRFAAPCLTAGDAVLLRHAPNVQGCAEALTRIIHDAGFPPGLFALLRTTDDETAEVIRHPAVRAVSLTGSPRAGRAVAQVAGSVLKKCVLELGGSDAYVVLADADPERAANVCVQSRLTNSGQSCIAAKRFVVTASVAESFTRHVVERMAAARTGDPLESEDIELGPLARSDLRDTLHAQVESSVRQGAKLLLGGKMPAGRGWFYPPTVLADVPHDAAAACEETFGPVAAIVSARDDDEAIAIANDSDYGLGAAVFTRDTARGEEIAAGRLDAGMCFVNDQVRSDPRLPFGGIKDSGLGRELGIFGLREMVNVKTVFVK